MAGRPPAVTDYEILDTVHQKLDEATDPALTTAEVTADLPIKREGVGRRLNALSEQGLLARKQVGGSYIWWLPDDLKGIVDIFGQRAEHGKGERELQLPKRATGCSDMLATRLHSAFEAGTERFSLGIGGIARVDPDSDEFVLEYVSDEHPGFEPGTEFPLSETFCTTAVSNDGPATIADAREVGVDDRTVYTDIGLRAYLGTFLRMDEADRTFFFVSTEPRDGPFSETDVALVDILGQRVKADFEHYGVEATGH